MIVINIHCDSDTICAVTKGFVQTNNSTVNNGHLFLDKKMSVKKINLKQIVKNAILI